MHAETVYPKGRERSTGQPCLTRAVKLTRQAITLPNRLPTKPKTTNTSVDDELPSHSTTNTRQPKAVRDRRIMQPDRNAKPLLKMGSKLAYPFNKSMSGSPPRNTKLRPALANVTNGRASSAPAKASIVTPPRKHKSHFFTPPTNEKKAVFKPGPVIHEPSERLKFRGNLRPRTITKAEGLKLVDAKNRPFPQSFCLPVERQRTRPRVSLNLGVMFSSTSERSQNEGPASPSPSPRIRQTDEEAILGFNGLGNRKEREVRRTATESRMEKDTPTRGTHDRPNMTMEPMSTEPPLAPELRTSPRKAANAGTIKSGLEDMYESSSLVRTFLAERIKDSSGMRRVRRLAIPPIDKDKEPSQNERIRMELAALRKQRKVHRISGEFPETVPAGRQGMSLIARAILEKVNTERQATMGC